MQVEQRKLVQFSKDTLAIE